MNDSSHPRRTPWVFLCLRRLSKKRKQRRMETNNSSFDSTSRNALEVMASRTLDREGYLLLPWLDSGLDVLEVGCGPGTITLDIAACVMPGRVTGLESSACAVETAQRLATGRELVNARFIKAHPEEIPCLDESYDLVFSHGLLDRMGRVAVVMDEIHRVLRTGGRAIIVARRLDRDLLNSRHWRELAHEGDGWVLEKLG